ncbi:helix-turn-helix domain-containing protein [Mycolicibacterium wolinskyi]|uniref:ArsR family transcriptional regulator n=1 Tax=Mycolicibacterium wolinskyi TaxID=59750 RepID=A0A1X2FIZ6_9MYCO|nr:MULTISPECIES: helix-turn-helix domain-containing protein [Mycolicibacterium]MCV7288171.1 helix-turn-helix domain-containing protein [Mycolicibacterium wolinskyi]MCV7296896.1 helix-turn-helix domain-containing protein [Mycolicibacterium goodii]ORX18410.1 ArsR family transcriptional regulator [Mycolicibacterium wolinskyi]
MTDSNSSFGRTSRRAAIHAALADPARLAIVDLLLPADASPSELRAGLNMRSNLMAHHLKVLEEAGVVTRTRSEADRRRTYLRLNHDALEQLVPCTHRTAARVVFVCTQNSARSQIAAAIWNRRSPIAATSAGTHPVGAVHPGALAAARRHNVPITPCHPRHLDDVLAPDDLVIAVCDNAHEELPANLVRMHWSVADPARSSTPDAFDATVEELSTRIEHFLPSLQPA